MTTIRYTFILGFILSGCQGAPALADAFPPGHRLPPLATQIEELPPGDLLGYQPAPSPDRLFDPPVTGGGSISGPTLLASWRGAPEGFSLPGLSGPGLGSRAGGNNNGNNQQDGGNGNGNQGCGNGNGGPRGGKNCDRPHPDPNVPGVPGPVPVLGAGVAFGWARKMRRRVGR